jgi:regulator of protease activity HflC (stomatin/prohibitin superfamily)
VYTIMLTKLSIILNIVVYNLIYNRVDMNKSPISFRLSDREYEVLEQERQERESINQTAARLLREKLGIIDVDNVYTLESTTLKEWIVREVNAHVKNMQFSLETLSFNEIAKINERLDAIEKSLPKPRTRKST